jgi:hypothetical protein
MRKSIRKRSPKLRRRRSEKEGLFFSEARYERYIKSAINAPVSSPIKCHKTAGGNTARPHWVRQATFLEKYVSASFPA